MRKKVCINKYLGFTLAEVLITLGIIGVVAAMTIPTLIANINGSKYRNQFKKAVSTLSQAARMNLAQYDFDFSGVNARCGSNAQTETPETHSTICAIFNANLSGATYYSSTDKLITKDGSSYNFTSKYATDIGAVDMMAYQLADGTIIILPKMFGDFPCTVDVGSTMQDSYFTDGNLRRCYAFIDVNGTSLPNTEVTCSSGSNSLSGNTCVVKNDAKHMTDIFPVRLHDGIVEPATAAARYVLKTAK